MTVAEVHPLRSGLRGRRRTGGPAPASGPLDLATTDATTRLVLVGVSTPIVPGTMSAVTVGLGWDPRPIGSADFDVDALALLAGPDGKVRSHRDFVFYNNLRSEDGSVVHLGDNLTGDGTDDEQITVDLASVSADVDKIAFAASIYDGEGRNQTFGQVRNAYIRLVNPADGMEIARYDLAADAAFETAMLFGEMFRSAGGAWKFRAVGQGHARGMKGLTADFGVTL